MASARRLAFGRNYLPVRFSRKPDVLPELPVLAIEIEPRAFANFAQFKS